MRFPWLQVDAEFLATGAGDLAELLRSSGGLPAEAPQVSEAEAGWAMVRLLGWAISKAEKLRNALAQPPIYEKSES